MSSASETISSQISTNNVSSIFNSKSSECIASGLYILMWVVAILMFVSFCMSLLTSAFMLDDDSDSDTSRYPKTFRDDSIIYRHPRMYQQQYMPSGGGCGQQFENFENNDPNGNEIYSYSHRQSSSFQSVPLTAPDNQSKSPSNMMFGQANRHLITHNAEKEMIIDISANLYVLDGNILNQTGEKVNHSYKAIIVTDNGEEFDIGKLKRDGDGIYKVKFTTKDFDKLVQHKNVIILYEIEGKRKTMLQGQFR